MPDEQFCEAVNGWLAGVPFATIRGALIESGLPEGKMPSAVRWSQFWREYQPFLRVARRRSAVASANKVASEAKSSPVDFDAATIELIRQMAFELADSDSADPKELTTLVSLLLKYKDQALKERQVSVAERRLALLEQREEAARDTLGDVQLTPDQREQRMREIFGIL